MLVEPPASSTQLPGFVTVESGVSSPEPERSYFGTLAEISAFAPISMTPTDAAPGSKSSTYGKQSINIQYFRFTAASPQYQRNSKDPMSSFVSRSSIAGRTS